MGFDFGVCHIEADSVSQNDIHERTSHDNELLQEHKAKRRPEDSDPDIQ